MYLVIVLVLVIIFIFYKIQGDIQGVYPILDVLYRVIIEFLTEY